MARLTKVCIPPTEPLSRRTTKLTLEFYKVISMLRTVFNRDITTLWTNKFLGIETLYILFAIHDFGAIFTTSEIGPLTLETQEICINGHGILVRFIIVRRILFREFLILVAFLEFESLNRHFLYFFIKLSHFTYKFEQFVLWRYIYPFFA